MELWVLPLKQRRDWQQVGSPTKTAQQNMERCVPAVGLLCFRGAAKDQSAQSVAGCWLLGAVKWGEGEKVACKMSGLL